MPALEHPQVHTGDLCRVIDFRGSHYATGLGSIGENTPLQQKGLLASLLLMVKHGKSKEVTQGKLVTSSGLIQEGDEEEVDVA